MIQANSALDCFPIDAERDSRCTKIGFVTDARQYHKKAFASAGAGKEAFVVHPEVTATGRLREAA